MKDFAGRTVWIIGAGSGIGRALATELSRQGAKLVLSGRDREKLEQARPDGSAVIIPLDVTMPESLAAAQERVMALGRPDSMIYLAGVYEPADIRVLDTKQAEAIIATNLTGAIRLVRQVLPHFLTAGAGQIALCASLAGYCGLPGGQPYSATKAALINFTESLRAECRGSGVDIRLITPGFVRTPMTDKNDFSMPMRMEPEDAARAIAQGLKSDRFEITFPGRFSFLIKFLRLLPYRLYFPLVSLCAKKR